MILCFLIGVSDIILSDVRKKSTIPVIIISAKETTQNKIDLLRLGDDYITKPFDIEEVLARIESNLRRVQFQNSQTECLQYNNLTFRTRENTAFLNGIELSLTAKEFGILELLMKYPDKVFSKSNLFKVFGIQNILLKIIHLMFISVIYEIN